MKEKGARSTKKKETDKKPKEAPAKSSDIQTFDQFSLCHQTRHGLAEHEFITPTIVQRKSLPYSLAGRDVLGAAKTGSGKTLAFILPALELLHREHFQANDGLGVLILTPTRELAFQIFEVLKSVGKYHNFSAALIIGGRADLKYEKNRIGNMNILICTPGRILQHMDENPSFDSSTLRMLILDEADRILSMGFRETLDAIIENLPPERQTLLFSATQTRNVDDLARLALKNPVQVFAHEKSSVTTPKALHQTYIKCEVQDKFNVLYAFMKANSHSKVMVFLSTRKQVRFASKMMTNMRTGIPIVTLYGTMNQLKRMAVYEEFTRKQRCALFATDIAARGLDFPGVHWVIQMDCAEDVNTYIHRVGRTARVGGTAGGESILFLMPSEMKFLDRLKQSKIPIEPMDVNPLTMRDLKLKFQSFMAENVELHELAKLAFVSYVKFVYKCRDKEVFDLDSIDLESYSQSLGLIVTPRLRFLKNTPLGKRLEEKRKASNEKAGDMRDALKNLDKLSDDDFLVSKSASADKETIVENTLEEEEIISLLEKKEPKRKKSKARQAKAVMRRNLTQNTHISFNSDDENEVEKSAQMAEDASSEQDEAAVSGGINIEAMREKLRAKDREEKKAKLLLVKQKKKEAHDRKLSKMGFYDEDEEEEEPPKKKNRSSKKRHPTGDDTEEPSTAQLNSDVFDFDELQKHENIVLSMFNS